MDHWAMARELRARARIEARALDWFAALFGRESDDARECAALAAQLRAEAALHEAQARGDALSHRRSATHPCAAAHRWLRGEP